MEIEIFTLCDFSEDFNGKLCIIGTFDAIWVKDFPAVHPTCSVAARIRFNMSEAGKHPFKIMIIDEDGKELMPSLNGEINVKVNPGQFFSTINIGLTIGQLRFQKAGEYLIALVLDGRQERSLPLIVKKKA